MNFIEACEEMENGKKVRRKVWAKNDYMYVANGIFQNCKLIDGQKIRKILAIDDLQTVLADDWEIYRSEEETLIKKGKMLEIARYCNKHRCDKSCLLYEKRECGRERECGRGDYWRYDKVVLNKSCLWEDDMVENSYKIIKEEV